MITSTRMFDEKYYLLASVFASKCDTGSLIKIVENCNNASLSINTLFDIICVFWPELDDSSHLLRFLNATLSSNESNVPDDSDSLLVDLLESNNDLIPIIEVDNVTINERYTTMLEYVNNKIAKLDIQQDLNADYKSNFIKNRIILVNSFNPTNALFNEQLWLQQVSVDDNLKDWIYGVVYPLYHLNSRFKYTISITDFEKMPYLETLNLILSQPIHENDNYTYNRNFEFVTNELIPYCNRFNCLNIFLEEFFNIEKFDILKNYDLFKIIFFEFKSSEIDITKEFEYNVIKMIYENEISLLKNMRLIDDLILIFDYIKNDDLILNGDITNNNKISVEFLKFCLNIIKKFFPFLTIHDIIEIKNKNCDENLQILKYNECFKQVLDINDNNVLTTLEIFLEFNLIDSKLIIFDKLNNELRIKNLIQNLLEIGEFKLLIDKFSNNLNNEILLKFFWKFFNSSNNGSNLRPEMIKANEILKILNNINNNDDNNKQFRNLDILLELSNELSEISMNFGYGIPFCPKNIIDCKNNKFKIINIMLELNDEMYKDIDKTKDVINKMNIIFDIKGDVSDYVNLLNCHINYSMERRDFNFACLKSLELINDYSKYVNIFCDTIFKLTQYSNEIDEEINLNQLLLQLEIIGKLINICPIEETEKLVIQWSALELELATRDIINEKDKDIEENNYTGYVVSNLMNPEKMLTGVSSTVSKFFG